MTMARSGPIQEWRRCSGTARERRRSLRAAWATGPADRPWPGRCAPALFARQRTGRGDHVSVSLLSTAMWLMASDVADCSPRSGDAPRHWPACRAGPYRQLLPLRRRPLAVVAVDAARARLGRAAHSAGCGLAGRRSAFRRRGRAAPVTGPGSADRGARRSLPPAPRRRVVPATVLCRADRRGGPGAIRVRPRPGRPRQRCHPGDPARRRGLRHGQLPCSFADAPVAEGQPRARRRRAHRAGPRRTRDHWLRAHGIA